MVILGKSTVRVWWLSRYSLLSMLLGTLPLVLAPQGRDLIVALADDSGPRALAAFYLTLTLWALSVWYWSRVLLDAELAQVTGATYRGLARHLPRALGVATLLLPAIPIWRASVSLTERVLLMGGCAFLALIFGVVVLRRRQWFRMAAGPAVADFSLRGAVTLAGGFALMSAVVSLSLFVFFVWRPLDAGRWLGAVGILFIAAANTVFLGSVAVFVSRAFRVPLELIAAAAAVLFSLNDWNDNHLVRAEPASAAVDLDTAFRDWQGSTSLGERPVVFLVAAEGGGIRAAYWTATVLGALTESSTAEFPHRLFLSSGISGGTLGSAVYAALRQDQQAPGFNYRQAAQRITGQDFLSPTIAKLVSGDFLQWFLPRPVPAFDRSTAIEDAFAEAYRSVTQKPTLSGPVEALRPSARDGVPALVMNITIVESGGRAVIAPFTWPDEASKAQAYQTWVGDDQHPRLPPLVKAIHNSARFLYVSPAGHVETIEGPRHLVDGGYFDPTGAETVVDLLDALQRARPCVTFVPIYISNATVIRAANDDPLPETPVPEGCGPAVSKAAPQAHTDTPVRATKATPEAATSTAVVDVLGELFNPVRALLHSRAAHGDVAVARLREAGGLTFGFCPMTAETGRWAERAPTNPKESAEAEMEERRSGPPLGWQLSELMKTRLDAYWSTCHVNTAGVQRIREWLARR